MIKFFSKSLIAICYSLSTVIFFVNIVKADEENVFNFSTDDTNEKIQFSDKQIDFLKKFFSLDVKLYSSHFNAKTITQDLNKNIVKVLASKLSKDYKSNEIKADIQYLDKEIIIRGKIDSINRGMGNSYYLLLQGNEIFDTVHAEFDIKYKEILSQLNKEQIYTMHCICNGMLLMSPMLSKCEPIEEWINLKTEEFVSKAITQIESFQYLTIKEVTIKLKDMSEIDQYIFFIAGGLLTLPNDHPLLDPKTPNKKLEQLMEVELKKTCNIFNKLINHVTRSQTETLLVKDFIKLMKKSYLESMTDK